MSFRAALIVVCALACSTSVRAVAQCTSALETQIKAVRDAWKTNWNAKQLNDVVALYAANAVLLPSDGTRATGQTEIKDSLQKQLGSKVAINSAKVDCSGELAYDSGSYTVDITEPGVSAGSGVGLGSGVGMGGGAKKHIEGQYLVVLKHERGGSGMGGNAGTGGKAGMGGGGDIWRIVQHAATAKP